MSAWLGVLFALTLLAGLAIAARRAATVLVLDVEEGRIVRARGRAPGEMLRDLGDAVRGAGDGRVELHLSGGGVEVRIQGLDPGVAQRVRNVVGRFPAARLKTAGRVDVRRRISPGKDP